MGRPTSLFCEMAASLLNLSVLLSPACLSLNLSLLLLPHFEGAHSHFALTMGLKKLVVISLVPFASPCLEAGGSETGQWNALQLFKRNKSATDTHCWAVRFKWPEQSNQTGQKSIRCSGRCLSKHQFGTLEQGQVYAKFWLVNWFLSIPNIELSDA